MALVSTSTTYNLEFQDMLQEFRKSYAGFDCQGVLLAFVTRLLEQTDSLMEIVSVNANSLSSVVHTAQSLAATNERNAVTIARLTAELSEARADLVANQGKAGASTVVDTTQGVMKEAFDARDFALGELSQAKARINQLEDAEYEFKRVIEGAAHNIRELEEHAASLSETIRLRDEQLYSLSCANKEYTARLDKFEGVCSAVAALSVAKSGREAIRDPWERFAYAPRQACAAPDEPNRGGRSCAVSESDPRLAINEYVSFLVTQMGMNDTKAMERASYEIAQNIGSSDGDHSEQEQEEHNTKFVAERIHQLMGETVRASHSGGGGRGGGGRY